MWYAVRYAVRYVIGMVQRVVLLSHLRVFLVCVTLNIVNAMWFATSGMYVRTYKY